MAAINEMGATACDTSQTSATSRSVVACSGDDYGLGRDATCGVALVSEWFVLCDLEAATFHQNQYDMAVWVRGVGQDSYDQDTHVRDCTTSGTSSIHATRW